jgi:hypothetical protein
MCIRHKDGKIYLDQSTYVTTKIATPTKVDSKLTKAQLESCRRATEALEGFRDGGQATKAPKIRVEVWWIAQKTLLSEYEMKWYAIYTTQ